MSDKTVYLYKVYVTSEAVFKTIWSQIEPTEGPKGEVIDTTKTSIIDQVSSSSFRVEEPTSNYYRVFFFPVDIPASTPGTISHTDISFPMDILLWITELRINDKLLDDEINIVVAPDSAIGILTADALINDNTIQVSSTVIENVFGGVNITINDGVNIFDCGMVTNIDNATNTLTIEKPLIYDYLAIDAPVILLNIIVVQNLIIDKVENIVIGEKGFRGKPIPANMILRIFHKNNDGLEKKYYWRIEYYYGLLNDLT